MGRKMWLLMIPGNFGSHRIRIPYYQLEPGINVSLTRIQDCLALDYRTTGKTVRNGGFFGVFFFFCGSQSKRLSCTAAQKSKQKTVGQEGVGSTGDAFSPRLLPHRFLFRPRYSISAAVSLTNRTTKEKKKNTPKKPPATQATRPVKTKSSVVSVFR